MTAEMEMTTEGKSDYERYREARAALSDTQLARVLLKQKWEQCSAMAVFHSHRSLFDPDREQDEDELKACRDLIANRPELFRSTKGASDGRE